MTSAVIFDLDGTVLDNEGVWEEAFRVVAERYGVQDSGFRIQGGWWHEPGIGVEANWRRWVAGAEVVEKLSRETRGAYRQSPAGRKLKVRDGLEELVAAVKDRGWRTALATSSAWYVVEEELEALALQLAFDVTTTGEEVLVAKPDPEIYLLTAQKLELEPVACVVVEDSVAGVRAAVAAGMKVVGIVSDYAPAKALRAEGATWQVGRLANAIDILNIL